MARTKAVAIKNPSNSSSLESEFVHSPSHRTLDKGKDKAIYISSEFDSEATMTLTPPHAKDIVIDSPRKICSMKLEKSEKKKNEEVKTWDSYSLLWQGIKEKFDKSWVQKKVVYGRYIDLLEIKKNGWDVLYFIKKLKWIGFFEMYEPVYLSLVRAFFVTIEVDKNNFTLKATLKGIGILISEQLLADLLGVPADNER